MATVASSSPREALALNSSLGIAIPMFTRPVKASGGSRKAGRGIGEENVKVRRQEKSPFYPDSDGAVPLQTFLNVRQQMCSGPGYCPSQGLNTVT